ncbi:MAG: PEP-CTERM system TPR-repeat protein PrsT, partial [Proteobacteria bacterium]|nr:PEP-CTERM system TPR-repeat protein PrsT [Pseudomonadota bacterium]
MKTPVSRRLAPAATLAMALLLSACSGDNPDALVASAQDYLNRQDAPAAIIQLKNALKAKPDLVKARLMLGQALLATGDAQGAETELKKAQDLGAPADEIVPLLVHALLQTGQYAKVTSDYAGKQLSSAEAQANLKTSVAIAWLRQGKPDNARDSLNEALKIKSDYAPAQLELARTSAMTGDLDGALAGLDKVPRDSVSAAEAFKLRGDLLLHGKRDMNAALAAYEESVKIRPSYKDGQAAVIELLIVQGKLDDAEKALQQLVKEASGKPMTLYLEALLAFTKKDYKTAQEKTQNLLRQAPESYRGLELAGMTELQLGANVQAEAMLSKALQINPGLAMARRGLVTAYMRLGRLDSAMPLLPSDTQTGNVDPAMLSLAGQVYMLRGDVERAQRYFARAASLDPKDPAKRTTLALSHLAAGQGDSAIGELQSIAASDQGVVADMALINALLQQGKTDQALKAIDALQKKRPSDVLPPFLRGRALLQKRDVAGARKAMEQALQIDANYFPATGILAVLDNAEKRPDAARARLEAAIKAQPGNIQAYQALLELRAANGADKAELAGILRKAVDAAPSNPVPRVMLVEHYLRSSEPKEALSAAQNAVTALPDNVQLLDVQGRAQAANGEHNQAQASFNRMAALQPQSPQPYLRMSTAYLMAGDQAAAADKLRKALELDPSLLEAQQGLTSLAMAAKKPDEALAIVHQVQKQRPKEAVGYLLEGEIEAAGKNWDKSIAAFRTGLKQTDSPELAVRLYAALQGAGKKPDAERWAADWTRAHPKDATFPFYLGNQSLARNELP